MEVALSPTLAPLELTRRRKGDNVVIVLKVSSRDVARRIIFMTTQVELAVLLVPTVVIVVVAFLALFLYTLSIREFMIHRHHTPMLRQ